MTRLLPALVALFTLLLAAPLHAQQPPPLPPLPPDPQLPDAPPAPAPQAEEGDHDAREILGTWMGLTMGGEELDEGDFVLTFKDDGTGSIMEGGDKEPEPFTYTYDPDTKRLVIFFDGDEDDAFPIDMTFDGDTATFAPEDDDDILVARRVPAEGGDGEDAAPERADLSDSPLVGRWELVSFNGEPMPDDTRYIFHNHPDGTGTSTVNGEPGDGYTWHHDFETGVATFTHPDQEPAAFTFEIEDGVATYVSTDQTLTIVERRLDDGEPADSGEGLVGTWVGLTMDGEALDEGEFVITFNADGTGHFVEGHDDRERFTYTYNADARRCVLLFDGDEDNAFPLDVTFDGDTATFTPENEDVLVARRVVEDAGDDDADAPMPAEGVAPLVGEWEGVSNNGEPVDPDDSVRIVFHADGTGEVYEDDDDAEPFTWSYDADAETCTINANDQRLKFLVSIDGDTMTFESDEEDMFLVMRRIAEEGDGEDGMDGEEGRDGADGQDGADGRDGEGRRGDADFPEGVEGTWYAQKAEGVWLAPDEEFRLEFRADGTAHAFENGDEQGDAVQYIVDESRRVIQIIEGGDFEVELAYVLFDDVMVLTIIPPADFADESEDDELEIVLSRYPEGNEEHQRLRAEVGDSHPASGDTPRGRARRMVSMTNLRGLSMCVHAYFADHNAAPDTLGAMFEYVMDPETYLMDWQGIDIPEGWDRMDLKDQSRWLDDHTGYAYIGRAAAGPLVGGAAGNAGEAALIFELPIYIDTAQITVAFADGHVEVLDYDQADDMIEAQTGRNLMGWMDHLGREQRDYHDGAEAAGEAPAPEAHDHAHEEGHDHDHE